jgi:hypothetical protein
MDLTILVPLFVIALGAVFMYFVGAVIIQALKLSIIQVKSDVRIKMDHHEHELERKRFALDSKRLALKGKTVEEEKKQSQRAVTTVELSVEGNISELKEALETIEGVKKFAILKNSLLIDIEGEKTPNQIIEEIEKRTKITVTHVHFAKNPEKTTVRDRRA